MKLKRTAVLAGLAALTLTVGGCASADKSTNATADAGTGNASMNMDMASSNTGNTGSTSSSGSAGGVSGSNSMPNMSSHTTTVLNAQGVPTPVPVATIASGSWKEMKIVAQTMTPVPFYVYDGEGFREIKPTKQTSFHLMVMLNDSQTGVAIPYATVWAVISKNGKTVFNERQWDMLSKWMGPHYGNDVTLPGPGTYTMKLLISAPVAALHAEYDKMWVGSHTLTSTFTWTGTEAKAA